MGSTRVGNTSDEIKKTLSDTVKSNLRKLRPLPNECYIYRVPKRLRQINEKAYTPQLVSIGPFHHGKEELQAMQDLKNRYLQEFLQHSNYARVDQYIEVILKKEIELQNYYAESTTELENYHAESTRFSRIDFVLMMLVDATFIVMLMLKASDPDRFGTSSDRIFKQPWMINEVICDILLLENQLPYFIFDDLLKIFYGLRNYEGVSVSMIQLTHQFFKASMPSWVKEDTLMKHDFSKVKHFVHFLRICLLPISPVLSPKNLKKISVPSVTQLQQSGVKFKLSLRDNIFDIRFRDGILEIPSLKIEDPTEIYLRNMHAFEQCHYDSRERYLSYYISFMTMLVNAPKDVELLDRKGIIENWLRNNEAVSSLFHNLVKGNMISNDGYYFSALVEHLNTYHASPWQRRKAILKHNYFNTPWAGISVLAATTLLILTIIQTVCSILQVVL